MHTKKKINTNYFCKSNHWPKRMAKIKDIVNKVIKNKNLDFKKKKFIFFKYDFYR